jgi:ligand-binding sensor domain-containing protein
MMKLFTPHFIFSFRVIRVCLLWFIWLWCGLLPLAAQYHFDQWTTAQGLPHNNITAITQARDGYLWLGTADGLARFDGVRFTVFNTVNTPGFSSNRINCLFEDRHGVLWIGTDENGLMHYAERRFTPNNDGLPDKRILRIDEDDSGALWVYSETGIARRQGTHFRVLGGAPWDAFHPSRQSLDYIRRGPWYVDEKGLHRLAWGRVTTIDSAAFGADPRALQITSCHENPSGTLWIITAQRRLYGYQNGQLTRLGFTPSFGYPYLTDRQGGIWFYKHPSSFGRLTSTGFHEFNLPKPLGVMLNLGFYEDREGTLWLTSMYSGLFRARPHVVTTVASPGIASYAMYQDRQQTVWLTHYLQYTNGQVKRDATLQHRFAGRTTAVLEDVTGAMFFGTENNFFRVTEGRVVVQPYMPSEVSALHRDATGVLWAGTGHGLYRVEPAPLMRFTRQNGLATDDIRVMIPRRAGGLWIGGYGGLTQYHNERFTAVTLTGMRSDRIRSLYEDEDGVLWIGTYDGGLGRLHNGLLTSYTTLNGLYNDGVFQILPDQFGYFWMSSNRGIYRVRKAELNDFAAGRAHSIHCTNFNQSDGMSNEECNGGRQPAGFVAADGKLWFATQEGAAVVDPADVPSNPQPPPVVIETCRVDNEAITFEPGLRLEPGQSNLEIQYTGLSLIKSEQMQFRYRLLGLDDNWT